VMPDDNPIFSRVMKSHMLTKLAYSYGSNLLPQNWHFLWLHPISIHAYQFIFICFEIDRYRYSVYIYIYYDVIYLQYDSVCRLTLYILDCIFFSIALPRLGALVAVAIPHWAAACHRWTRALAVMGMWRWLRGWGFLWESMAWVINDDEHTGDLTGFLSLSFITQVSNGSNMDF
jgi:hypothetical protein